MNPGKARKWAATVVLAAAASAATAQHPPASFPLPVTREPIQPRAETQLLPASATTTRGVAKSGVSFREAAATIHNGTRETTSAVVQFLGKVGDSVKHATEFRPIIIQTNAPAPIAQPAAEPQVVVVRETVIETRPLAEAPASVRVDTLLLSGLGLMAVGAVSWLGFRKSRKQVANIFAFTPAPLDPNAVNLMGKYNAGPKRDAAEKFDLGPTYHEELKQKERQVEANNAAAAEFILSQNLAFLAEINSGHEIAMLESDPEGFAVPAAA